MSSDSGTLLRQEPPLKDFTGSVRTGVGIYWYRTKLPPGALKELHGKSDLKGSVQTLGYVSLLVSSGFLAWYAFRHWSWLACAGLMFLYGMISAFLINAVHELGHGTVFRTKWLNTFFCHVFAFLGWINHETFQASHIRHHRYTLHPPDDLEVVLPIKLMLWHVFKVGFFNPGFFVKNFLGETIRIARGRFSGEWEETLYPKSDPDSRVAPVRWARLMLAGHLVIIIGSLVTG